MLLLVVGGGVWFITSGDDDDSSGGGRGASLSSDEQEYAEAIASVAEQDPDFIDDDDPFGEEAIPCLAELVVELAGVDRLAQVGTPDEFRNDPDLLDEFDDLFDDNMNRQEAEMAYDTVAGCVDWEEAFISEGIPGVSESELRCVVGNLESGALQELFINIFMGQMENPEAERQFEAAGRACGLD